MWRQLQYWSTSILIASLVFAVGPAWGQSLNDVRITEIHEDEQWFEVVNTGDGPVDVSAAEMCANVDYNEIQTLTVRAHDDAGNEDLTLDAGEYLALEWEEIDVDDGDLGLYQSGTSSSGFGDPSNIIDYVRWGDDGGAADREDTAVEAGIWTAGDFVESAQAGATMAFLGDDPAMNDDPASWDEGNPTPASGNVVLPVELTAFDVTTDGTDALLTWTTASETNNAGFEVQHRKEGPSSTTPGFERVGFVDGVGTTTQSQHYQFRLTGLSPGRHAFRLRQVDVDGSSELGPTVEVTVRARVVSALRPNPTAGPARLTLSVRTQQSVRVEVYNLLGQHVRTVFEGVLRPGRVRELRVDGTRLSSGTYFVQIVGEQFRHTRKFVVAG